MYEVAIESEACVLLIEIIDLVNSASPPPVHGPATGMHTAIVNLSLGLCL